MTTFTPGRFVWHDIITEDIAGAKAFYGELFDWSFEEADMGRSKYTMFTPPGKDAHEGGFMELTEQMKAQGIPPHWMGYVSTADIDAATARASAAGGQVHVEATEIPNVGRFAVVADPTGGVVSLFQGKNGDGADGGRKTSGDICWDALGTTDLTRAKDWYAEVVGWSFSNFGEDATNLVASSGGQERATLR